MSTQLTSRFASVYGPVKSWRYGRSLGIDPIGSVSVCSFNCVYCQLGEIEKITSDRSVFIPTEQIRQDLEAFAPWDVDVITLSGSGEPTLAANLGEILASVKEMTHRDTLVLTNGTLLSNPAVQQDLALADRVSVKIDAVSADQLRRVNRAASGIELPAIWAGIEQFALEYGGTLGIQTMILAKWDAEAKAKFIAWMQSLMPDEIQLNTPKRPKPIKRQIDGRGNHSSASARPYAVQNFKCVSAEYLQELAIEIKSSTGISVRYC